MSYKNLYGPFDVSLKVHMTSDEKDAVANFNFGPGEFPSPHAIQAAIETVVNQVRKECGEHWRVCTKREYFDQLMRELTGTDQRFSMLGGKDWADQSLYALFAEIETKRTAQDEQWGGPEHDDTHSPQEWFSILDDHVMRLIDHEDDYRERLIKIAALAVAAAQSWDRVKRIKTSDQ